MKCQSTRFGTFEVNDDTLLVFPSGILGFPEWSKYVLLDHDTEAPFKWLQCVEEPQLAFVILDPDFFKPDYQIEVSLDALIEIQKQDSDELSVVTILTIPSDDPTAVTANLRGPLVMNHRTRLCKQLVLSEDWPTRYPLFSAPPRTTPHSNGSASGDSRLNHASLIAYRAQRAPCRYDNNPLDAQKDRLHSPSFVKRRSSLVRRKELMA
jgi:flagellar assembly factor FliW